ncbi:polysaccharide biosynthesis tyrosine autokinase [Prevotella copri]|uniref:non-specific protein-tyrosine kinase n=1 Tax=Segatella copri TaxID=165179 RepID=A0A6G1U3H8_9BACT|nr:tyrosine-protein kinase [Segatella copri]MQN82134.1 polysaccharide biosynthesis tyrosine autokinase [Segatella copri]
MEENKNLQLEGAVQEQEEKSAIDFQLIYTNLILNWKWFVLSLIVCLGLGYLYLRYATPAYQASTKVLIKDDDDSKRRGSLGSSMIQSAANLGFMSNSNGIDNEIEILSAHDMAQLAVHDMKIYVNYYHKSAFKDPLVYKEQEVSVDLDLPHLKKLNAPIKLSIEKEGTKYHVKGTYNLPIDAFSFEKEASEFEKTFDRLPATISTRVGMLTFTPSKIYKLEDGEVLKAVIVSPEMAAKQYTKNLTVSQTSKTTTIAELVLNDENPQRALDYLNTLLKVYNRQANEDKNEIAYRTEQFINNRLQKINAELGNTEGQLESYKKRNKVIEMKLNATATIANSDAYAQKLQDANTQVELLDELGKYMNEPGNKYQPIPSNVGLTDESSTELINQYNKIALDRNNALHAASETSPTVTPLTAQLDALTTSIKRAMRQAKLGMEIQRNSIAKQAAEYAGQIGNSPEQERVLTQIGRQQEVKSGLYLMLLEKREENSISLAATADKGKIIDAPSFIGKVSPKSSIIMLIALVLGLAIPAGILFLIEFFKYKIEGHEDVIKLTQIPVIADIPVASDAAKKEGKADIVVHQNVNNLMEEIFRGLRTNIQFMLKSDEKVMMFTSSTSGEGKTFVASNISISLALLGKKVIMVGLDIRKPRLAELFQIDNHHNGITNLIVHDHNSWEDIQKQIVASGVNSNLDILMAGPVPPNPGELVTRASLDDIINQLKQHYDYVILDTAPVGLVNDSLQLGRLADLCVYVCRADYTPKASFGMINGLNAEKKLPNMCLVLNGVDLSKKKHSFYYGVGKYGKYGKYGNYGSYGSYGKYGKYGKYGTYGQYGSYGNYSNSHYGNANDTSIKK